MSARNLVALALLVTSALALGDVVLASNEPKASWAESLGAVTTIGAEDDRLLDALQGAPPKRVVALAATGGLHTSAKTARDKMFNPSGNLPPGIGASKMDAFTEGLRTAAKLREPNVPKTRRPPKTNAGLRSAAKIARDKMLNPSGERSSAEDVTEAQKKAAVDAALDVKAKEVKAMTPTDVEARLSARGLSTHGNKKELIGRLRASKMNAFAKPKRAAVHAALHANVKAVKAVNPTDVEARLSARGLSTHGSKKQLVGRLRASKMNAFAKPKRAAVHAALHVNVKAVKEVNPADVEARLSARGLSTHGSKKDLVGRLRASKMNAFTKRTL